MTYVDDLQPTGELRRRSPLSPVIDELRPQRGPSRFLSILAVLGLISAVFHMGIWLADDTAWAGPVSWRKPIVFSFSLGMLSWAIGWLLDRLPHRKLAWWITGIYSVFTLIEIVMIIMQAWRGQPSHFNEFTNTDSVIWAAMGISVVFMSLAIVMAVVWSLIERPPPGVNRMAAYAGFAMVVTGLGVGQWIIGLGNDYVSRFNEVPPTVTSGEAGLAKFPHGIAFHGIHVFAVAAALSTAAKLSKRAARRAMTTVIVSYAGLLLFSALQTLAGRAPTDLGALVGAVVAACAVVLLGAITMLGARAVGVLYGPDLDRTFTDAGSTARVRADR